MIEYDPAVTVRRIMLVLLLALLAPTARADEPPAGPAGGGLPAAEAEEGEPETLEGLLAEFARLPGLEAHFREEKRMALLAAPLVNEGTFHYAAPGLMARHTTKPVVQSVVITERKLRMGDTRRSETIDLDSHPVVRQFLDSFMPILRGDRAALEELYTLGFERLAEGEGWRLRLAPKVSPMKEAIAEIAFTGRGLVMRDMVVKEKSGDETLTTFSEVKVPRAYEPAERERVFRLQDPKANGAPAKEAPAKDVKDGDSK